MIPSPFLERVHENEQWTILSAELPSQADALALFKLLAVQKWLGVPDDVLLREVDDRRSLRSFCGFDAPGEIPSPAHLDAFRRALVGTQPELLVAFTTRWAPGVLISVVSPVYRAEGIVDEFVRQVTCSLERITPGFEIVLVDDGSGDGTWARIAAACAADDRVKAIKLSRNFGQHFAITAGLDNARGAFVVVMDCDLQDDPAFIPALYAKGAEGYDVVLTSQRERAQGFLKRTFARLFAGSVGWTAGGSGTDWLEGGYSLLSRRAVDAFRGIGDVHRHYLNLVRWLGFSVAHVPVAHRRRHSGKSSYSLLKLIRHAIDGWVTYSNRLLYLSVALGFSFLLAAMVFVAVIIVMYFVHGFAAGWPSLVVLILTCTGAILMSLGVLGIHVGKIFDQVRGRPLYVIERTLNRPTPGNSSESSASPW